MRQILLAVGYLVVLVALGFGFVLSFFDHHAAERIPWHKHILLNGNVSTQAQILAFHHHAHERPHPHHPSTGQPSPAHVDQHHDADGSQVVVIFSQLDGVVGSFAFGHTWLAPAWPLLLPILYKGQRLFFHTLPCLGIVLDIPDPPPRISC